MTARPNAMRGWNLDLADKRVQAILAERTLTRQQREAERRAKEAEAKRIEEAAAFARLPFHRRWYIQRTRERIKCKHRWEADRLTARAEFEGKAPPPPLPPPPPEPEPEDHTPPPWKVRKGWHPWVVDHARLCAQALGIDIVAALERNDAGHLLRHPHNVRDRAMLWRAMREIPTRCGLVPSYPEIGASTGVNHSTVLTAIKETKGHQP